MLLGITKGEFSVINVLETTWDDNDCSLIIVIGPQVADTNFKETLI